MDISSARLTALLREAMILAAVPSAKADPAKAALIKALVQPPTPSGAPLQPAAAPALQALLSAAVAKGQQTGSAEILQAYLALAEPGDAAPDDFGPTTAATGKATPANDDAQRGLPVPPARADDGAAAKPAGLPWFAPLALGVSPPRRASATDAKRGQAMSGSNDTVQPEGRQQMRVGLMALAAGFLAVAIVGLALLVLG
ncbi:hypothetical protein NKH34_15640 [Mesorhizobium sp. M1148]|uniref:hypothetical protein n=1 Tax=unclassified Mesorhizobium TaxID=325217 RepID=UPI0003CE6E33|nr:hypothetical protein [Mesorhizobium sp. LNJC384A00]ESY40366.1 hypothetical protein X747_20145 [Mesorhizobium sp. LNJC384A00]